MLLNLAGIFLTLLNIADVISVNVTVNKLGIAIGILDNSKWSRREFYSFRGIPFAKPPTGDLRYALPVPVDSWTDNYIDATKFGNICPQTRQSGYDVEAYDEDCLHLNVYVPRDAAPLLPVMVWLHGGNFISGHAQRFEPHYLMESDIILVVPQFRLGALGLLYLGTKEIPGNVQFIDQVMAMQWVQDNIGAFGGDKNRVTLFGQSSGSYSVNLHLVSPLSKGLFHQAILESNAVYATAMIDRNPIATTKGIANTSGCDNDTFEKITQCMKSLTVKSILNGFDKYMKKNSNKGRNSFRGSRVVIENGDGIKFLTEEPTVLIERGEYNKVPLMGGTNAQDGSIVASLLWDAYSGTKLLKDPDFLKNSLIPLLLDYFAIDDRTSAFSHILTDKYFRDEDFEDFLKMVPGLTDIGSVILIKAGMLEMLYKNSRFEPTYLYSFDYRGNQTRFGYETVGTYPFDGGVAHSDEYILLFPFPDKLTARDTVMAKKMVRLWSSFAIDGKPSEHSLENWPKMSTSVGPYLKIGWTMKIGDYYIDEYTATIDAQRRSSQGKTTRGYWIIDAMEKIFSISWP